MGNQSKIKFEYYYHSIFDRSSGLNPQGVREILDDFFKGTRIAYSIYIYDLAKEPHRAQKRKILITPSFLVEHERFTHKFVANEKTLKTMLTSIVQLVKSGIVKQSADGLLKYN